MIAGSDFRTHTPLIVSHNQRTFNDDSEHTTIADLLNWKNYSEDYPASPTAGKPFLGDRKRRYARKHVPFLSFRGVQNKSFHNVVAVDTHAQDNAFVTDIGRFIADPQTHPLPEYMFYSHTWTTTAMIRSPIRKKGSRRPRTGYACFSPRGFISVIQHGFRKTNK